ncbi:MAG: hypothetical protein WCT99_03535 [Bacteroidota bacterium]|jgi:hypothetical protein
MKTKLILVLLLVLFISSFGNGQMKSGVDLYSRYIWRGTDYGNAASLQPALTYVSGDLSVGVWGAYALTGGYSEADIWGSYAVGPITLYVTDYYIPATPPAITFFNYSNKGGAHVVEVGAGYTGPESFPLSLSGYVNVLNDANNSVYITASYPIITNLGLTVGMTPAKSIYGTTKAGLIGVGLTTSKTIKVTEDFSIPFNAQYIMNPYSESAYLIFGISL